MTESDYYAVHKYDPSKAAHTNWGTAYSDLVLTYGQTQVTLAACLAGAIASIKVGGREFIASGGHGASFQLNTHPTSPSPGSECYNPTEAGSKGNDIDIYGGQYHGPSTSALWADSTYWKTGALTNGQQYARTYNRMAYYVPANMTGYGNCIPSYPATTPASYGLSSHLLDKEVRLGIWKDSNGVSIANCHPFIGLKISLTIENLEPTRPDFNSVLIAYLLKEFNNLGGSVASSTDGYSFGLFAQPQTGVGTPVTGSNPFMYSQLISQSDPLTTNRVTTIQSTWYASNVIPGVIEYIAYAAAGPTVCVNEIVTALAAQTPVWE